MLKKSAVLFMVVAALSSCGTSQKDGEGKQCRTEESCIKDANCQCWCSQICGYRKKTSKDTPVYIGDDSNSKFCYCNQWDYDHYNDNCILHKNIKEPGM